MENYEELIKSISKGCKCEECIINDIETKKFNCFILTKIDKEVELSDIEDLELEIIKDIIIDSNYPQIIFSCIKKNDDLYNYLIESNYKIKIIDNMYLAEK